MPASPPPVPTRAPRTNTASRIEEFIDAVEQATEERIPKKNIWLVAGYRSDTEFRQFQGEKLPAESGIVATFNRVLKMPPKEFIEKSVIMRKDHEAYVKSKCKR